MRKVICVLGMLLILSGCDYELPKVDAGSVRRLDGSGAGAKRELTSRQIAALSDWFAAHRDGWTHEIADVFPGNLVTFRRKGADVVTVDFASTQVRIGMKVRSLSVEEGKTLARIIDGETD